MRFREFKINLLEFANHDYVVPEIDIIGPTDPATASINKQNALLLLQMTPDPSDMQEIQKLLQQFSATADTQPLVAPPDAQPSAPAAPPEAQPAIDSTGAEDEDQTLAEGKKAIDIGSKVALLNENDPEQAELLARIEAILESKKIEPVIANIVNDRFTLHLSDIINAFKNAMVSAKVSITDKVRFLASCKKGFVDLSILKTTPQGNLYTGITGVVFDAIKDPLFKMEFGTGGNKLGKGEALLAIIGKGASKGASGDLQITTSTGTEELEIKASSGTSASGAVLVALGKGEKEDGKARESAYGSNTEAGKKFKIMIAKAYSTRTHPIKLDQVPNSVVDKSITKFFNPFILKNPARGPATIEAFKSAYKIIFKNAQPAFFDQLDTALHENGINTDTLIKIIRAMEFDYYKSVIKHDAVLFINGTTGTYRYIDTGASLSAQLLTSSSNSAAFYSLGVIDFSGTYGNGFGKIFTK